MLWNSSSIPFHGAIPHSTFHHPHNAVGRMEVHATEVLSHLPTSLSILCTPCKKAVEHWREAHQGHCIMVHNPLRRECGFAQALLSQWHKQAAKEVFLYALLECQGAQSPEGHSQEVPVGSQQHPQGEHQHRIPNSCWQPAPRQTILLGSALKGSGAFQCMVWHSLSSPSPDPTGLNRSKAPKSIWP